MDYTLSVEQIKQAIQDKLAHTFGVSLENATDEVKAAADVITLSNDREGAAAAIEKYILRELRQNERHDRKQKEIDQC